MLDLSCSEQDRRFAARTPVRLVGRLWHGPKASLSTDCTLRDLSQGGARVECAAAAELPSRLFFAHEEVEAIFLAQVRWRNEGALGLQFAAGYGLENCRQSPLEQLAAEWRRLFA